ncbi:hypothetical protein [Crossiella cryophila]|uniref:Uncharacterized protein n=1 Tax=Crossiella cryophila TaxID=43355 RepID=A0A7W7FRE9_9PSEU|nr:hypothetical protein [Crossiella cryophila]MBB4674273.1 hypothetical protein [Crossiella cryophila]
MTGWHRPLLICSAAMAVLAVVCLAGLVLDERTVLGAPLWLKPFKFAVSNALYGVTWAWLASLLGRGAHRWCVLAAVIMVFDFAIILGQALRGRPSHFNLATPLDTVLYVAMGLAVVVLWLGTAALTLQVLRTPIADPGRRWALRLGTGISLLGLAMGGLMVLPRTGQSVPGPVIGAHSVGVPDSDPGLALTGWSSTGGDLRIPHFLGMHALQALPLFLLLLTALGLPALLRARLVLVAGAGYLGLLALVTWQALRGQPLLRPDALTLTALAVLVLGLLAAAVTAAATSRPAPRPAASSRQGPAHPAPPARTR